MPDISGILGGTRSELVENLDWDAYKGLVAMNPSTLVHGTKSMRHLKWAWDHGRGDTPSMQWGRAVHCLLFEPKKFATHYACWHGRRAGNDYKDFVAECEERGREVLAEEGRFSYNSALQAAESFVGEPLVQEFIKAGKPEVTVFAVEQGIQCRGRVDWLSSSRMLVDLKTAKDITARGFGRDFYKYHYDIKLGMYRRWVSRVTQFAWPVTVICLENEPPYDVAVVPIPDAVLERGVEKGLAIMHKLPGCIKEDHWPGVSGGGEYYLDTPTWEMDDDDLEGAEEVEGEI